MKQFRRQVLQSKSLWVWLTALLSACSGEATDGGAAVGGTAVGNSSAGLGGAAAPLSGAGGAFTSQGGQTTQTTRSVVASGGTTVLQTSQLGGAVATTGGSGGVGGTTTARDNAINGGATSAGGTTATGGTTSRGGTTSAGGTTSRGGTTSAGGTTARGGTTSAGGTTTVTTAIGGTTATGGTGTPALRIVGRTAPGTSAGAIRFSWPGVSIYGRFTGTQVSMDLNDGTNKNRFTVVVDNGAPKTVTSTSGQASLSLAMGLTPGTHDIVIWRNTEAGMGVTQFNGLSNFGTGGALLAAGAAPERRIEVIGDSLSVGAGDEGNATCAGGIDAFTNNYLAYGSVAARTVGAEVVTIAWSGIGVYRNYDGSTTNIMPTRYPYAIANDNTLWDFAKYQPQVVVINLGTNDFGAGDPGAAYETAYVNFVKTVRSKYATANFVLIDMYGGNRLTRINNVVAQLKAVGELKVETLSFSSVQNNLGCNQHPNVSAQAAMGNVLATRLKSLMGW